MLALVARACWKKRMSGDGVDIGAVYQLLREVADTVAGHGRMLSDHGRMLERLDRRLDGQDASLDRQDRKLDDLSAELSGLRRAVTEYHSSVLGHGILISELEERVRRIEQHLNLPPVA